MFCKIIYYVYIIIMAQPKFNKPSEMKKKDERVTISARIKSSTASYLEKEATDEDLTFSAVVSDILDSYVDWLESEKRNKRGGRG